MNQKFACLKHSPIRFGARGKWKQVKRGNGRLNPPSAHYHSYYQWCRNQEKKMKSSTLWQLPSIAPLAHLALSMVGSWWNWLLDVCEGGKQRRQFHHVCDNVQRVFGQRIHVEPWHIAAKQGRRWSGTTQPYHQQCWRGGRKREEGKWIPGRNVLWKDGSDRGQFWTAFGLFSISTRKKLAAMNNWVNRVWGFFCIWCLYKAMSHPATRPLSEIKAIYFH